LYVLPKGDRLLKIYIHDACQSLFFGK